MLELITVIAITAILVTLSVPMVQRMTEKGKITQRMANLQAISRASILYATDNQGILPSLCSSDASGWSKPFWYNEISPYLPNKQTTVVSSTGAKGPNYSAFTCPFVPQGKHMGSDYAGNSGVFFAPGESPGGSPMRLAAITNPGEVILALSAEVRSSSLPSWYINAKYYVNYPDSSSILPSAKSTRHPFVAAIFVDGHYEEITPETLRENRSKYFIPKNLLESGWQN